MHTHNTRAASVSKSASHATAVAATTSSVPDSLIDLRLHVLLPYSVARAQSRLARLRQLFLCDSVTRQRHHEAVLHHTLRPMRLTKSVRNVASVTEEEIATTRVETSTAIKTSSTYARTPAAGGATHQMCVPLTSCTTVCTGVPGQVMTGSVDGMLTLWDVTRCQPRSSRWVTQTPAAGSCGRRIRALAAHPHLPLVFASAMFDTDVVSLWRVGHAAVTDSNDEIDRGDGTAQNVHRYSANTPSSRPQQAAVNPHEAQTHALTEKEEGIHRVAVYADSATSNTQSCHAHACHRRAVGEVIYGMDVHPSGTLLATAHGRLGHVRSGEHAAAATAATAEVRLWDIRESRHLADFSAPCSTHMAAMKAM